MTITAQQVNALRQKTGVSMMACKQALVEADGDENVAIELLHKRGEAKAAEKSERVANEGLVACYVHGNQKLASMVQIHCETDFVARSDEFKTFAHEIAMHVAAAAPQFLSPQDVPDEMLEKETTEYRTQLKYEKKPEKMWDQIIQGKLKKYTSEICLLTQPFIKNPEITIEQLVKDCIGKLGENIKIERFSRFQM